MKSLGFEDKLQVKLFLLDVQHSRDNQVYQRVANSEKTNIRLFSV